jgi:hypothetical protein
MTTSFLLGVLVRKPPLLCGVVDGTRKSYVIETTKVLSDLGYFCPHNNIICIMPIMRCTT